MRALIYARFSPGKDNPESDLKDTVERLKNFAASLGITEYDIIDEYDVSAWTDNRKGRYPEVFAGLESGKWNYLVVRSFDRCTRDILDTIKLIRLYERGGWKFAALNGDTLDDKKSATIRGLVADWESDEKSHRMKEKWAIRASKGLYHPGRFRPYGYQLAWEDGKITNLEIDPAEAPIVREVADRVLAGESLNSICLDLEHRGVPTVSGARWERSVVKRILKPVSAGLRSYNGELIEGNWPAIIDRDTFDKAKAAMNPGAPKRGKNTRRHLLTGLAICGRCGMTMLCNSRVYLCSSQRVRGDLRGCGKVARTRDRLEELISELVIAALEQEDFEIEESIDDDWKYILEARQAEIDEIQAAYERGEIASSDWLKGLKVARANWTEVRDQRDQALAKATGRSIKDLAGSGARERWEGLNLSQRRAVLSEMISAIVVKPAGKGGVFNPDLIEIIWQS